jgi:hypothetical protein
MVWGGHWQRHHLLLWRGIINVHFLDEQKTNQKTRPKKLGASRSPHFSKLLYVPQNETSLFRIC